MHDHDPCLTNYNVPGYNLRLAITPGYIPSMTITTASL